MPKLKSLLSSICIKVLTHFKISKRMYRNSAVLVLGAVTIAVVSFGSEGFAGSGKNAVLAYAEEAEAYSGEENPDTTLEDIGVDLPDISFLSFNDTDKKSGLSIISADSRKKVQLLVGEELLLDLKIEQENEDKNRERIVQVQEEIKIYKAEKEEAKKKQKLMEERRERFSMQSFSDEDYNNFLRIVEAESGDQDIQGKMIVANVILNRVKSPKFPNTLTEVIFSKRQFSPVSNGRFYKVTVANSTITAVERALNGEDNSKGALYFMNRAASDKRNVRWFDNSLKYLFSYADHEYFK